MLSASDVYWTRLRRVLAHIDAHLDEDLSVERLAGVAGFSRFHFHRQFAELLGIGVHKYVQGLRLRRASSLLAFRPDGILEVALDSGYESHEAFTRAFKKLMGQTPSEFRERPDWRAWSEANQPLTDVRRHMKPSHRPEDVKIVQVSETRVGVLEHRGDPRLLGDTIRRFIEWRKQSGARPPASATFNLFYDDPALVPPEQFRLDLCAQVQRAVAANDFGVVERTIPAGRCAVLRHVGSDDGLGETLKYLYAEWLPASGEELRDFPLYAQRVTMFPDVPEHEAVTDVFLPLK
jgi:AraC family transcriptional regulator